MSNNILVTGGCGFVGANLVRALISDGENVVVLDDLSRGQKRYLDGLDVHLIEADIRNANAIDDAFRNIDRVVHLAAFGSVVESVQDPVANFEINAVGTFNVLNKAKQHGIEKIVFSSTGGALIGDALPPVNEESLPHPISPYGASKLCGEAYFGAFSHSYGIKSVCLRFANVYGPFSYHKTGVINKYFGCIKKKEPLIIFGDGSSSRDYIHVSDLVWAIKASIYSDLADHQVMHIASGEETTLTDLANTIMEVTGCEDFPIEYKAARTGEVDRNFADNSLANRLIGFKPKFTLKEGLKLLWDEYEW